MTSPPFHDPHHAKAMAEGMHESPLIQEQEHKETLQLWNTQQWSETYGEEIPPSQASTPRFTAGSIDVSKLANTNSRWIELDTESVMSAIPSRLHQYEEQRKLRRYWSGDSSFENASFSTLNNSTLSAYQLPGQYSDSHPMYRQGGMATHSNYSLMFSRPSPVQSQFLGNDAINLHQFSRNESQVGLIPPPQDQRSGSKDEDLVTWDGPDDPENPKNWSDFTKWQITLLISLACFLSTFASAMIAPALPDISKDFDLSQVNAILALSIYILGYAVGPLFFAPLSEVYGRGIVLQSSMGMFFLATLGCSLSTNKGEFLAFRLLSGIGSSAALVVGGGTITDVWPREKVGKASSLFTLAPLIGPSASPIVAGFVVSATTWRWLFWGTLIADALFQYAIWFALPETYATVILKKKRDRLRKKTGNQHLHLQSEINVGAALRTALIRPFRLLGTQPIVQLIAIYMAYIFGLFYLIISSFTTLWTTVYDQSVSRSGLNFISLGLGYVVGTFINAQANDRIYARLKRNNNGVGKPEFRIPLMFLGSAIMPLGMFIYGATASAKANWIFPNIGMAVMATGSVFCLQTMQTYVIESYTKYAASALAAVVVLRSIAGFLVPLAAPKMYGSLGYGWGNITLAIIGIVIGGPAPFLFWFFGERLRKHSQYAAG